MPYIEFIVFLVILSFIPSHNIPVDGKKSVNHNEADNTILMAHVIFRHGNRTPEMNERYPKDPYLNNTYFPIGIGQLTNEGKVKEFNIGKLLRARYDKLLGKYYYPDLVDATSTDYNRTKASLQLVLASLFQPNDGQIWNSNFNWQPVPYNYRPIDKDEVLYGSKCPNYEKLYKQHVNSPKLQAKFAKYKTDFNYISHNSGLNVTSFQQVYDLYFGLSTEEEIGLKLPQWTKKVWPKTITNLAIQEYYVQTGTTKLLQISEGFLLRKIIDDTTRKIDNINLEHGRKMYLYSAHENNVADMLILLNVFDPPHIPNYGAFLIFEVHHINKTYGFKLYYQNYVSENIQLLKLPACGEFCPMDKFISLVQEYLPTDDSCGYIYQSKPLIPNNPGTFLRRSEIPNDIKYNKRTHQSRFHIILESRFKMNCLLFVSCVLIAGVSGTVHHNYIFNRFDSFSDNDYRIIFPNREDSEGTLQLVNVLFRHGNRTADSQAELYPKDPYFNYTYFPYGLGQLTNAGKKREYDVGVALRRRYDKFLGKYYYPEIIEAISTDYNRTKMSLQLVLAGLFPPRREDMFQDAFFWQPVPFNYLPRPQDKVLLGVICPNYLALYDKYVATPKVQQKLRRNRRIFDYISQHSGLNVTRFIDVYQLYFGLSTEQEYGLELPAWTASIWPETVINMSIEEYYVSMGTSNLRKMAVGYFLHKVLEDAKRKMTTNRKLCRKIHLYSAHENNIAQLLIALGVFNEPHVPNYGAYAILELHKIRGIYGFKIFYDNWTGGGPQLLKMPGCGEFCPLDKFVSLIDEHLPVDHNLCGN
nr:uncharacterized protein LOC111517716 [Leptinotarsa decemlineata]